jgi:hypothetical protein
MAMVHQSRSSRGQIRHLYETVAFRQQHTVFVPDYIVQRFPDIDDVHEDSQDEYPKREPHHRRQNHAYRHYGYSYAPPFMRLEKQQVDVKG